METWKPVKGYESLYLVSDKGRVKNIRSGVVYPVAPRNTGTYVSVALKDHDGIKRQKYIHRLVVESFIGSCAGLVVNHKNGNPSDNRLVNLELSNHGQNAAHSWYRRKMLSGPDEMVSVNIVCE